MPVDYEKLINLDYTAYERSQDFQEKLDKYDIKHPLIEVRKDCDGDNPAVEVAAVDDIDGTIYREIYPLEGVTTEEFEEVMFGIWKETMEELEP